MLEGRRLNAGTTNPVGLGDTGGETNGVLGSDPDHDRGERCLLNKRARLSSDDRLSSRGGARAEGLLGCWVTWPPALGSIWRDLVLPGDGAHVGSSSLKLAAERVAAAAAPAAVRTHNCVVA